MQTPLVQFIKGKSKQTGMTQEDLSFAAGVGLRFVRELEQGKPTLRMDKDNLG
ncbi:MAG: transcriptional regulator [Marinoscillum sp.]